MKTLAANFVKRGEWFELLKREGSIALYRKTRVASTLEVIRIRIQKARTRLVEDREIHLEEKELYPGDNDFGISGWSYPESRRDLAEERFKWAVGVFEQKRTDLPNSSQLFRKSGRC